MRNILNNPKTFTMSSPLVYKSLESILNTFERPEYKAKNEVKELLEIYEKCKDEKDKYATSGIIKYPLIIVEGLDGSGKSTITSHLAKNLNAVKWQSPPKSISHIRSAFDDDATLRTSFYSLGNYIAALEVQLLLAKSPVIVDRYWQSTAAFAIAQAAQNIPTEHEIPPEGDKIYEWPKDLFKPALVLLLNVTENIRLQRLSSRKELTAQENLLKTCPKFRNNVIQAYRNMYNPTVTFVDGDKNIPETIKELLVHINPLLMVKD